MSDTCNSCEAVSTFTLGFEWGRHMMLCGGCKQVRYCGTNCPREDWPKHKAVCAHLRDALKHLDSLIAVNPMITDNPSKIIDLRAR